MRFKAGIEKSLKFVQSFSQVAEYAVASSPKEVLQWKTAKEQTNLGKLQLQLQLHASPSRTQTACVLLLGRLFLTFGLRTSRIPRQPCIVAVRSGRDLRG